MAHLVETMAYAGETPWHGLGTPVSNDLSAEQMMKAARLDWTVSKRPLFMAGSAGYVETEMQALVRDSDQSILTYVPDDWNPLQNAEAFSFFHDFVEAGEMNMETAGSLMRGRRTWALAKVNEAFKVKFGKKEDVIENYLLFSNPHEYGRTITIDMTPIRVVCNNTLTLALNKASSKIIRISHKNTFDPDVVKEIMFTASAQMQEYQERAEFLASKKAERDDVMKYFATVFPSFSKKEGSEDSGSRNADLALEVLETQPGANLGAGTWWQPYNAVTFLMDHKLGRTREGRVNNIWFGQMKSTKVTALNKALEFAKAA